MKPKQESETGAGLAAAPGSAMGWIYYKFTTQRGATYERNIRVRDSRLAALVASDPSKAFEVIKAESMPNLQTLHVFSCGVGESPNADFRDPAT